MNVIPGRLTIAEFFNPYDSDHLAAYQYLAENGAWPEGFLPEGIEFSPLWQMEIANEMTRAWLRHSTVEGPGGLFSEASAGNKLSQDELAEDLYQALIDAHNRVAHHFLSGTASEWTPEFRAVRTDIMCALYRLRIEADRVRAASKRHLQSEKQT